jgi:hypothetical protein
MLEMQSNFRPAGTARYISKIYIILVAYTQVFLLSMYKKKICN